MREALPAFEDVTLYLHDIMMNSRATPWYSRVASSVMRVQLPSVMVAPERQVGR